MSFFLVEKLSIIVQKFSKCLKNGNDRLRKGKLFRRQEVPTFFRLDIEKKMPFSKFVEKRRKTENENGSLNSVFQNGTRIPASPD